MFKVRVARVLVALIVTSAAVAAAQENTIPAKSDPQFRLLYFTADWCGPCQLMQRETWPVPAVQAELKQFQLQQVDIDDQSELAEQWGVRSIPTFIIAAPDSDEPLARVTGFMDGDRMPQWLRDGRDSAEERQRKRAVLRQVYDGHSRQLENLREEPESIELDSALEALFALLAMREEPPPEHEKTRQASLAHFATNHPDQLVAGLLHPDLQVRVYISRSLSSEALYLDPWASPQQRQFLVRQFRAQRE